MRGIVIAMLVVAFAIVPSLALPEAHACRPMWGYCPLGGYWYSCGTQVPPPIVTQCLRQAEVPGIEP